MPKISIVTAYYNRKEELHRTLKVLAKSSIKDFEFIIVDDASAESQRIEDLTKDFTFVKLARIEPRYKYYFNPCVPFNFGLSLARGDVVILQSPECMHMGDVLEFVVNNSKENQYLVFACYSLSAAASNNLNSINFNLSLEDIKSAATDAIGGFTTNSCETSSRYGSWFSHPIHRKCIYNFLVSMTKKDLDDLGGFDERFADGHGFDDTDFAARVVKKGMEVKMIADPFCLHQYHRSVLEEIPNFRERERQNRRLYEEALKSPNYKVKNSFWEKAE